MFRFERIQKVAEIDSDVNNSNNADSFIPKSMIYNFLPISQLQFYCCTQNNQNVDLTMNKKFHFQSLTDFFRSEYMIDLIILIFLFSKHHCDERTLKVM